MGWRSKYKVVRIVPGKVIVKRYGEIDFSRDDLPEELCEKLIKEGCPYLEKIPPKAASPKVTTEKAPE